MLAKFERFGGSGAGGGGAGFGAGGAELGVVCVGGIIGPEPERIPFCFVGEAFIGVLPNSEDVNGAFP